jgi:hypothetical protein
VLITFRGQERCDEGIATKERTDTTGGVKLTAKGVLQGHPDT